MSAPSPASDPRGLRGTAVRRAVQRHVTAHARRLAIGGIDACELVARFGSPLFAYDAEVLREQYRRVSEALGPRVRVLHCLKANPLLAIAGVLRHLGAGAEVASAGEILVAQRAGHDGHDIHFAGPGKSDEDLRLACAIDAGCINLESAAEYTALAAIATETAQRPRVAIRVNPKQAVAGSRMIMAGASKKFGVDEDEVIDLARRIVAEGIAELRGLHVYAGTQCFDAAAWVENARSLLQLANRVEASLGIELPSLNFGGGFGVQLHDSDPVFDLAAAGEGMRALIAADDRSQRRYFVELGRYLVADAGVYLTRVAYLKTSQGKQHAIVNGGMHHHAAAAGIGSVIRRAFPMVHTAHLTAEATTRYCLGGPLCTPADELAGSAELPPLAPGDVVAILVSGAYGLTFSPTMFLGHPTPAEVVVDRGRAHLAREAGRPEDILRGQHPLAE